MACLPALDAVGAVFVQSPSGSIYGQTLVLRGMLHCLKENRREPQTLMV